MWLFPILAGLGTVATVMAWMVAMKHNSGTYLFPILGHGFDYSSYRVFPTLPRFSSSHAFEKTFLQGAVLLLLAAVSTSRESRTKELASAWVFCWPQPLRSQPSTSKVAGILSGDITFHNSLLRSSSFSSRRRLSMLLRIRLEETGAYLLAFACLLGCIFYYDLEGGGFKPFREMRTEIAQLRQSLQASLSGRQLVSPDIASEFRAAEASCQMALRRWTSPMIPSYLPTATTKQSCWMTGRAQPVLRLAGH